MKPAPDRIYDTLKRYWGFTEFRPVQLEIIRSVLEGRDTLALMPTGAGNRSRIRFRPSPARGCASSSRRSSP